MRSLVSHSALALALAAVLAGCSPGPSSAPEAGSAASAEQVQAESQRLNAWFDAQYAEWMTFSPLMLSFQGSKQLNDKLDDVSEAGADARIAWLEASVKAMESQFDFDKLDAETQTSWELWKRQYENERDGKAYRLNQYAFDQMNGMQSTLPMLLMNFHTVDNEADYLAYIARLNEVPRFFGQLLEHARKAEAAGTLPPRFALEAVAQQSRALVSGAPFNAGSDSALWGDLQRKADALAKAGTIDQARADELKAQARTALVDKVQPAYTDH